MHPCPALALSAALCLHSFAQQPPQPTPPPSFHWISGQPRVWIPTPTGSQSFDLQDLLGNKATIDSAHIYRIGDRWIIRVDSPARPTFLLLDNESSAPALRRLEYFAGLEKQLPTICRLFGWNDIEDPADSLVYAQYPGEVADDDNGKTMAERVHSVETIDLHIRFLQQESEIIARYMLKNDELVLQETALPQPDAAIAPQPKEQPPTLHKENGEILVRHGQHTHSLTAALGKELRLYGIHIDRMDGQWIIRAVTRGGPCYFLLTRDHAGERMEQLEYLNSLNAEMFSILRLFRLENKLSHANFRIFDANEDGSGDLLDPVVHETGSLYMEIDFRRDDYSITARYVLRHGKLVLTGLILDDNTQPPPLAEKE